MTTKAELQRLVERINRETGFNLHVDYAYGGPMIMTVDYRELSPRLPRGGLVNWLLGMEACVIERSRLANR